MNILSALLISCVLLLAPGCFQVRWGDNHDYLRQAEEASRQKDWDLAVASYRRHIDSRLAIQSRPDWENPWFYLLMIGDIELGRERPEPALLSYQEAFDKGVERGLVSDRFRLVATWYEQRGRLSEALDLLKQHREKDELLFDIMLDRISRELTRREDALPAAAGTSNSEKQP